MGTYALLLAAPHPFEAKAVARAVVEVCRRPSIDAMHQLYHGRGILAERLEPGEAQALAARLAELGLPVFCVPEAELVPPLRPKPVPQARVRPEGLVIEDQLNRVSLEPWTALRLVGLGVLETETAERPRASGARPEPPAPPRKSLVDDEEAVERRYYLDLFFERAQLHHYRLESGAFNYQYLAADERLSLRREDNFIALVGDVLSHAGAALVVPAARAMARGELDRQAVVNDLKLFDAEMRWQLQRCRALGCAVETDGPAGAQVESFRAGSGWENVE